MKEAIARAFASALAHRHIAPIAQRVAKIPVVVSQAFNAIGLNGHPDETVSAQCYRRRAEPRWERWRQRFDRVWGWFGVKDHCAASYAEDVSRAGWIMSTHGYEVRRKDAIPAPLVEAPATPPADPPPPDEPPANSGSGPVVGPVIGPA